MFVRRVLRPHYFSRLKLSLRRSFKQSHEPPENTDTISNAIAGVVFTLFGGSVLYVIFVLSRFDKIPFTGRRRYLRLSESEQEIQGQIAKRQLLEHFSGHTFPRSNRYVQQIQRILDTLIVHSPDFFANQKLDFRLVHSNEVSAISCPGFIIVYSGLIDFLNRSFPFGIRDDVLAAVIAHELAHGIAKHSFELGIAKQIEIPSEMSEIAHLTLTLPKSREMEFEADHISLHLLSRAKYDLDDCVLFWKLMAHAQGDLSEVEKLTHTHPPSIDRYERIREDAQKIRETYAS